MDKNTASPTPEDRISSGLPFVEALARRLASGMPHSVDLGDLVQDGMIGLIDAAQRFDVSRGIKFETFAERRVRGAMIDALRRDAWPRGIRRVRRELESAREKLRHKLGCEPSLSDLAGHLGTDEAQLGRTIVRIKTIESTSPLATADAVDGANLPPVLVPSEPLAPDKVCEHAEVCRRVRGAIAALPWRERTVIGRYYYSDFTMKQIGAEIGVNESRVSQLHTRAIRRLREGLGADLAPNALGKAFDPAPKARGGKLAMAKASLAATQTATRTGPPSAEDQTPAEGRTSGRSARMQRLSGRRARRPLKAVAARAPEPMAAAG